MNPTPSSKIYQENMKVLVARFPEVYDILRSNREDLGFTPKPFITRQGNPNLMCCFTDGRKIPLYREEDIIIGTEKLMKNWKPEAFDIFICHGLGLGYIPLIAARKYSTRPRIVIIENQPMMLDLALGAMSLKTLLEYERLILFVGGDLNADNVIDTLREYIAFGNTRLINHPAYPAVMGKPHKDFNRMLQSAIGRTLDCWNTSKNYGKQMIVNIVDNLPSLLSGTSLDALAGKFKNIPAVCVAAGPSLDKSLNQLKKIGNHALVIAGDSAVAALIRHDIPAHMVITVDQHKINFEKIRRVLEHLRKPVLIFGVESNPDNVRNFFSPRRLGITADSKMLNSWIGPRWNLNSKLPSMNSVGVAAIHIAQILGCDPIALVGMDLAYSGSSSHSKEATNHYVPDGSNALLLEGVKGIPVNSLPQLAGDKVQIEQAIAAGGYQVVDTSIDGAFIRGSSIKTLAEVVDTQLKPDINVDAILNSIDWSSTISLAEIVGELKTIVGRVADCRNASRKGITRSKNALQLFQAADNTVIDKITDLNKFLARFQNDFRIVIQLLESARLGSVQDLYRKREQIEARRELTGNQENVVAELEIIAAFFDSVNETVIFFEDLIGCQLTYFAKILEIVGKKSDPLEMHLDLARHNAAMGQLWRADEAYRKCLEIDSHNAVLQQEIIELYMTHGLWRMARDQLEKAARYFPHTPWLRAYEEKILMGIQALLDEAEDNLKQQRLPAATLRVAEYLSYCPTNQKARDLETEIMRRLSLIQGNDTVNESAVEIGRRELLSAKRNFFRSGEYERTIGILEGLIEHDPSSAAHYREEIGRYRSYQGDHTSAAWNFDQAAILRSI
jgi:hypothetical protein